MDFFKSHPCISSVLGCLSLGVTFVSSLYVWNSSLNRDHPSVIIKRSISVVAVSALSPFIMNLFIFDDRLLMPTTLEIVGLRTDGLIQATAIPLVLTMVLFTGPICMDILSDRIHLYMDPMYWMNNLNFVSLRNYVIAPLSEEFTFRACMLPILLQYFKPMTAIFVAPLFFGLAHVHHVKERLRFMPLNKVLIIASFQFMYTTLFGAYSSLLFLKTGHFIAPALVHSFCNFMGFPDFNEVLYFDGYKRTLLIVVYIGGVVAWCLLLPVTLTNTIYSNTLYDKF